MKQKIIIIGATSGIGLALAEAYLQQGHTVGVTGRRTHLLEEIKAKHPTAQVFVETMDVALHDASRATLASLVEKMGGADVIIINAGIGVPKATYEDEIATVDINVRGFTALAHWSYGYFKQKGGGRLAGVSSVAGVRSSPYAPEYHASKAFMSSYMEGLRLRSAKWKDNVSVTDIRPGFVDTPMTKQNKGMFWVATPEKAANQIINAIEAKRGVAYITKRYVLLASLLKLMPEWLLGKVM
jgi:short-subunit dehydrogenase